MPIELIDKIKPKNNGAFPLVDAADVLMPDGTRLDTWKSGGGMVLEQPKIVMPASADWRTGAYGWVEPTYADHFVAVAYDSNIAAYSTDGINWTETSMPASAKWESVAFGGGTFVAVAYDSDVAAYSTDGINWKPSNSLGVAFHSVTYGNGKFVAVGLGETYAYSEDGITWTISTLPANNNWRLVKYGYDKFVAIGTGNVAAYSTDGVEWTLVTLPSSYIWTSLASDSISNNFVLVSDGTPLYSNDGINWQTSDNGSAYTSVTYGRNTDGTYGFCAIKEGSRSVSYSKNGETWTESTDVLPEANWKVIIYGSAKLIALSDSTALTYSEDGVTWITGNEETTITQDGEDVTEDLRIILFPDGTTSIPTSIDLSALDTEGKVVETYADGTTKTTVIEFDEAGNPVKITDGDGNVTELTW